MRLPRFGKDWRMRWLYLGSRGVTLHRVASITRDAHHCVNGYGVTACGKFGRLEMPGFGGRMAATRCRICCAIAKVPEGTGAPYNQGIDA